MTVIGAMRASLYDGNAKGKPHAEDRFVTARYATLIAAASCVVLAGWIFHLPVLTRVQVAFAPTQFNTALCFLLYSAGLTATFRTSTWLPRLIGTIICLAGVATLAQSLFGYPATIDMLFGYYLPVGSAVALLRMADATAVAVAAIGAALWLCTLQGMAIRLVGGMIATLGSVVIAVAAGAVLGFAARMQSVTGWTGFTQIGIPTTCLCMIAGTHLLWTAWVRFGGHKEWLPIPLFFGLAMVLFTLTQEVRDDQAAAFTADINAAARQFALRAHARLAEMFGALDGMSNRWNVAGGTPEPLWTSDASSYLREYRGLAAIEWIDASGQVRRAVPAAGNDVPREARLWLARFRTGPAWKKLLSGAPRVTRVMPLSRGGAGFLYIDPLRTGAQSDGLQIAVVRAGDFLGSVFGRDDSEQYAITVSDGGTRLFSASGTEPSAQWTRKIGLPVRNTEWALEVSPHRELVSRSLSPSPWAFFWVGLLITSLAALSAFLALRWQRIIAILKEKEGELERSEERYERAVKGAGVGLWDHSPVTGEFYWSPRYREILGIADPAFVPAQNEFERRVHPEDSSQILGAIARAIADGVPYDGAARVRRDDGSYVWLRLRGIPTFDRGGNLIRLSGSVDDITALKLAEEALRASEETFRVTLDSAPVGIVLLSPDGVLIRANRAMADMLGYRQDELPGIDPRNLFPSAFDEDSGQIRRLIAGEIERFELEELFEPPAGKPFWALVTASLARNPDGTAKYIVKQVMDVSERREMDRMKSEFISVVSHELRTPLTAIRGSLGLMATAMRSSLPDKAVHLVDVAHRNCERLIALVNDILDMEKLAANRMAFEPRTVGLAALVRQSLEANAPYAQKYGVSFALDAPDERIEVFLDPDRLAQVLANLLSNAAKFSPPSGRVEISVRSSADRARVKVRDRGPGIPEEFRPRIFGRFMQADSSVTRAKGGTGLGLHITREIVERMGGWIGFESAAGQGTTFWIEFPLAGADNAILRKAAS